MRVKLGGRAQKKESSQIFTFSSGQRTGHFFLDTLESHDFISSIYLALRQQGEGTGRRKRARRRDIVRAHLLPSLPWRPSSAFAAPLSSSSATFGIAGERLEQHTHTFLRFLRAKEPSTTEPSRIGISRSPVAQHPRHDDVVGWRAFSPFVSLSAGRSVKKRDLEGAKNRTAGCV